MNPVRKPWPVDLLTWIDRGLALSAARPAPFQPFMWQNPRGSPISDFGMSVNLLQSTLQPPPPVVVYILHAQSVM